MDKEIDFLKKLRDNQQIMLEDFKQKKEEKNMLLNTVIKQKEEIENLYKEMNKEQSKEGICLVCNYKWKLKSKKGTLTCPRCKSKNWDFGSPVKCACCDKILLEPDIHHVDGDHSNNIWSNRVPICKYCHAGIHSNISPTRTGKQKSSIRREKRGYKHPEILFQIRKYKSLLFSSKQQRTKDLNSRTSYE